VTQGQDGPEESFRPTSGQVPGWIGLVLVAAVVVFGLADRDRGFPAPVVAGALVLGVLDWAALLRPRVRLEGRWLVLRNMLETVRIPLAAIEEVAVRQVLAVRAGDRRFVSPAVGRSLRRSMRGEKPATMPARPGEQPYPDFVEERIRHRAEEARAVEGVARYSDEQVALAAGVRREPAWPEIGLLALTVVAFVVTLVV
jgi:hypothetical protein